MRMQVLSSGNAKPSVNNERMAGNHPSLGQTEEVYGIAHVFRSEHWAERGTAREFIQQLLAMRKVFQGISVHHPRVYNVHTDAARPEFLGQAAGQRFKRSFRRSNKSILRNSSGSSEAREGYDPSTRAHERYSKLGQRVEGEGVSFHAASPMLKRQFQRWPENADGGVAHHDIQMVKLLPKRAEGFGEALGITDVCLKRQGPPSLRCDGRTNGLSLILTGVIQDLLHHSRHSPT